MIAVSLCGGLGNQMLQYAAALRLARKHSTTIGLDLSWYGTYGGVTPRDYGLDAFGIPRVGVSMTETYTLLPESGYAFDPSLLDAPDWSWIQGYRFSERYFADESDAVREAFRFQFDLPPDKQALAEEIAGCENSVAVFVRRSDYADDAGMRNWFGLMPLSYYWQAHNLIVERSGDATFFLFSDDYEWCRENFPNYRVIPHRPEEHACHDMHVASLCQHQIIANSTYGWWAAWLNRNPGKIVVAPEKWLADPTIRHDYVPEGWERI